MKKVFIIMETFKEYFWAGGFVNSVYEDLEEAKKSALELRKNAEGEGYYRNWIIERVLM